jgi:hypothetical protein
MLFQAVMKFLSRLVEFKILVNWGMVHSKIEAVIADSGYSHSKNMDFIEY